MSTYLPPRQNHKYGLEEHRILPIKTIDNVIVYRGRYDVEMLFSEMGKSDYTAYKAYLLTSNLINNYCTLQFLQFVNCVYVYGCSRFINKHANGITGRRHTVWINL